MTFPCAHAQAGRCSLKSPLSLSSTLKSARKASNCLQRRSTSPFIISRPRDVTWCTCLPVAVRAKLHTSSSEQPSDNQDDHKGKEDPNAEGDTAAEQKALLGQQKIAQWMATSTVKPAAAMSIEELKNAKISWQDTYKSKKKGKVNQAGKKANSSQAPATKAKTSSDSKVRGFGAPKDSSTVKLFRYGLEKAALQEILVEAGLSKKVVQVERIEDANAIIAIKLTKKGQHINLQQAERTATNAGIPLVVAGRRLSKDSIVKAIKPLLDKRSSVSSSSQNSSLTNNGVNDDDDDDWDQLEPADEFEQWDQDDLDSDVFDDEIKGIKTARAKNIPGYKPRPAAKPATGSVAPGGSIQAGSITLGRSRPRSY